MNTRLSPFIYRSFILLLLAFDITVANAQGVLTNGWTQDGTIAPAGDSDTWTFSATKGDNIVIKVGRVTQTNNFIPRIRLFDPNSVQQALASSASAAEIVVTATNSGNFTVIVDDVKGTTATGRYILTLAKTGSAIVVSPGDEGGPMTNGVAHQGNLPVGDLDVWNFTANAGDSIVLKVGQMSDTNNFDPSIRLYGPDGALVASSAGTSAAEVTIRATNSGTFLVVIGNDPYYNAAGSGTYILTLAKTSSAIVVSPGDEGGPMTNGVAHQGNLPVGDLDVWNFTANAGDSIVLKMGQVTAVGNFDPWIRLYGPDGALVASSASTSAAEVTIRATNSGTFLVVVGNNPYYSDAASGTYILTLAKTGSAIVVSPGDEGGPMSNGVAHQGNLPVGDLDVWNFTANAGDSIVLKVGQMSDTNNFDPSIRLYGPDGALVASSAGTSAAEVTIRATNSGTFLVVIGNDPYYNAAGSGTYILTLAKTGSAIVVSPGDEGGPMTNGVAHQGNLPVGDLDVWNFTANAGDSIVLKMGQVTAVGNFDPWIRLYGPDGALVASSASTSAAEVTIRATNSGTFLVVVGNNPYYSDAASGTYILTLAKTGSAIVVSPGDEGGPMTNGVAHQGNLPVGDLDVWNFTANAGDSIVLKVGQMSDTNNFDPSIRLYGPDGALVASSAGTSAAEVTIRATNSGTFLVVIGNDPYYNAAGSGTYILTLAKTGSAIVVSPGDEGGPMTNGVAHQGNLPVGDLDVWNFTANAGDSIVLKMGQVTAVGNFDPWIRLYGPDGALVASSASTSAAEVTIRATNSGTFLVVVGNNPYYSDAASGTYILTLAKTGSAIVVSPGDEGGPMTNGVAHQGNLPVGDLDVWNFTANAGDSIVLKMGQTSDTNNFDPWVRLYGPDGALLASSSGTSAAEVTIRATNSGTFLVVIGNDPYYNAAGSGTYILTLAKTGSAIVVSPGNEGGGLTGADVYNGNLATGGVDLWTFTICAGELMDVRADEINQTNSFDPWVRLYGPNGLLIASSFGTTFGEVILTATNGGSYLVLISNNPYNNDAGSGTYKLTVNGLSDGFKTCSPVILGTNVNVGGVGGTPGSNAILYTTTNIETHISPWTPIRTNPFDQFGVFQYTNGFNPTEPRRFYRLEHP